MAESAELKVVEDSEADEGEDEDSEGFECPRCFAEVGERDRFCWSCGRQLDPLAGCPACGADIQTANRFCRQCGFALDQSHELVGLEPLLNRAKTDILPFISGDDAERLRALCDEAARDPSSVVVAELTDVLDRYKYL